MRALTIKYRQHLTTRMRVPENLRTWFIIHFIADYLFAIPLFLFPTTVLTWFGWQSIDPFATRLVAAALFGIGGVSLMMRNETAPTYHAMLNLKLIWSVTAIVGMVASLIASGGSPGFGWAVVGIFTIFSTAWAYYKIQISHYR